MTGILDRIRATTPATLDGVSSDLSELTSVYRPRVARDMQRIVEGATDLRPARPATPNLNAGMVTVAPELQKIDTRPFQDEQGLPTPKQRDFIDSLMLDLMALDSDAWKDAVGYTRRMSENRAWNPGRGENVSRWIDRLKAKVAELKNQPKSEVVSTPAAGTWARWCELAAKLAVVGGTRGTRFAVDTEPGAANTVAFWRISPSCDGSNFFLNRVIGGQGPVKVRMSPTAMVAIAEKIIAAGPVEAMVRYGLELGECGHCGRELTNDESRAMGIGPRCRKHMGGWN